MARARANVDALRALHALEGDGRAAGPKEFAALAAYSGWGGAPDAFKEAYPSGESAWAELNASLRSLLSEDEYAEARASTLTAFYTPSAIARGMHEALAKLGFGEEKKGSAHVDRVLEPGCGTGNFMGVGDALGRGFSYDGVEIDAVSARIATLLHPEDNIVNASLDECAITKGSYDAVMGNVPYSDSIKLKTADGKTVPIHDYFIRESIEALRPGGVAALITSRYTMDKQAAATREWVAQRAELIGAVRLPEETFRAQAGTDVVSDVLVFRKRDEFVESPDCDWWVRTAECDAPDGSSVFVNPVFLDEARVIGRMEFKLGRFGYAVSVESALDDKEIGAQLSRALVEQLEPLGEIHSKLGKRAEHPCAAVRPVSPMNLYEFFADEGGNIWYGNGDVVEAVPLDDGDRARMAAMVALRDKMRELMSFERASSDDDAVRERIGELDSAYDDFVERFGRVGDPKNKRLWDRCGTDYSFATLQSAETRDASGKYLGKGDILSKRVQGSVSLAAERIADARDALTYSLDQTGGVDMQLICSITGFSRDDAIERLGDAVVVDPLTSEVALADAYLSGDVLAKLDRLNALADDLTVGLEADRLERWRAECGVSSIEEEMRGLADYSLKKMLNDYNGAWSAFCDPLGSNIAVDCDASFKAVTGRGYGNRLNAARTIALLQDVKPGCALVSEPDGKVGEVWLSAGRVVGSCLRERRYATAVYLLREAAFAPASTVSDFAFEALLATSGALSHAEFHGLMGEILPDPAALPSIDEIRDLGWNRGAADWRARVEAGMGGVAKALREDPDLLDYALLASKRAEEERSPYYCSPTLSCLGADCIELAEHKEGHEGFDAAHPIVRDEALLNRVERARERLEAALPARLEAAEIAVNLGSPWIPPSVYYRFAAETFKFDDAYRLAGGSDAAAAKWALARSPKTGSWQVRRSGAPELTPEVVGRFGTTEANPLYLMESALNGSTIAITKPDPNPPANRPDARVKDPVATAAAYRMRDKINDEFKEWAMSDPGRAELLSGIYNRRFNNLAPRHYDGSYLTLPGSSPSIELRAHQKDAVARVLQGSEGALVAHVVGAGKTFACIAAIMESRRVGKAFKPLVVVPNHLTEQWASDFLQLYPDARVLYMTGSDMRNQDATRAFWGRAAAGNWDAVIVGQSRFDMLRLSPEYRMQSFDKRHADLLLSIAAAKSEGNGFSVKQLEAAKKRTERILKTLRENEKGETQGVFFEQLGFDMLVVDEAHYYKNLAVVGRSVAGMSSTSSAKCENLIDICDYLRDQGHGSNIVFATGTPVSNTMSELYNMQRYLAPGLLRSQGVYYFSDWAQNFGQTVQSVEVKPESNGFQVKERFAKFHNLPELMAAFHSFADIMTQDDLDLDVPEVDAEVVAVEASEEQKELVGLLAERAEIIRAGGVDPSVDNLLKITSEGRALALSPRILDGIPQADAEYGLEEGKLRVCAENIYRVWEDTAADLGTQLVFCDASTPSRAVWNVYGEIKAQIVDLGIPAEQVAFIHDFDGNPKRRDALFDKVNAGEVRVLFGSTQKLGTGTNVQARLAAIHDVDCPWRPSDLEQRLGRVQRQGNRYGVVMDFRYVTTGTFDSYLYQTVERKQRFISQVFTNKCPARSGDDLDETVLDYATIKAVASGDPAVRERLMMENRLAELEMQRQAHAKQIASTRKNIEGKYRPSAEILEARVRELEDDAPSFSAASKAWAEDKSLMRQLDVIVRGETYPDASETARAIRDFALERHAPGVHEFGSAYGIRLGITVDRELNAHICAIGSHVHEYERPLPLQTTGPNTCLRQIESLMASVSEGLPQAQARLASARERLEQAEREVLARWDQQDEYDRIKAQLASSPVNPAATCDSGRTESPGTSEAAPEESGKRVATRYEFVVDPAGLDGDRRYGEASSIASKVSGDSAPSCANSQWSKKS